MDYWNRDENGNPVRKKAKEYNSFKTKGGRTVYDGGGIQPDIELETSVFSPITTALLKDDAIFDYATKYHYSHQMTDWKGFKITDSDFQDFMSFLKKSNFEYETETEKEFEEALRRSEDDDLNEDIKSSYNQLMSAIDQAKDKAIVSKKAEIMSLLSDEILKRYFYRDGLYNYQVENNPEILEAVSVLNNEKRYQKILK